MPNDLQRRKITSLMRSLTKQINANQGQGMHRTFRNKQRYGVAPSAPRLALSEVCHEPKESNRGVNHKSNQRHSHVYSAKVKTKPITKFVKEENIDLNKKQQRKNKT